jgi:hypothetical protein
MKILEAAKKETLKKVRLKSLSRQKEVTAKILCTAYKVAKDNQSFNNFEMEIDLQNLMVLIWDEYFTLHMHVLTSLITLAIK